MDTIRSVAVIGGGISGLAAALRLRDRLPEAEVTLIERDRRLGGKITTTRILGYVVEGGPDSFLASKPAGIEFCRTIGIEDQTEGTRADRRGTFVVRGDQLFPIPQGLSGLVPAQLDPLLSSDLLSPEGKVRVAREPEIGPRPGEDDESLASFMERRFGRELYERLLEPLMSGIYAGSGEGLSLLATFPQLRALEQEHGSLLRGLEATRSSRVASGPTGFLAPVRGMQQMVEAAAQHLGDVRVIKRQSVDHIARSGHGYTLTLEHGGVLGVDAAVVATPAPVTAALLAPIDPDLASAFAAVPLVSTATVALGYHEQQVPLALQGYGYVVPRTEGRSVTACTWVSSKWHHRAPEGRVLLRIFLGRAGNEQPALAPNQDMIRMAREEVRDMLGIGAEPELSHVTRWPDAMPQYTVGHADRMRQMRERLSALPGLAIAGNAIAGVGIPDCIRSGQSAADSLLPRGI